MSHSPDVRTPFDFPAMRRRREEYDRFVRGQAAGMFRADGTYQPTPRNDLRLAYWVFPAMIRSPAPAEREFANAVYAAGSSWDSFDVFCTSAIAVNLARHRAAMRADVVLRSEDHLSSCARCVPRLQLRTYARPLAR